MTQKIPEQLEIVDVLPAQPERQGAQARAPQAVHANTSVACRCRRAEAHARGAGLELGPVGRRRPARHAEPHRRRKPCGAARPRCGAASRFSLSIPMDEGGPQTGRILGRRNPKLTMLQASSRSPATRATSRRATTRSRSAAGRRRTGTRSRTPATTGCSTTACRPTAITWTPARRSSASSTSVRSSTRGVLLRRRPAQGRRVVRRAVRDHRRRPRRVRSTAPACAVESGRRRARAHRADALAARGRPASGTPTSRPASASSAVEWLHDHDVAADRHRHARVRAVPVPGRQPVPVPVAHDRPARHRACPRGSSGTSTSSPPTARRRRVRVPARGHAAPDHARQRRTRSRRRPRSSRNRRFDLTNCASRTLKRV